MGHTAEDVPRFVQRSAPRMKTSCYSAILNKALAFSKLPALAVRIAAPRQAASWGARRERAPGPPEGHFPVPPASPGWSQLPVSQRTWPAAASCRPHGALSCGRGPAGQGRDRPRADERGSSFSVCRGDMFSRAPLRDASWLQEKPPCPGKRPFLPAPEGRGAFLSGLRASAQSLLSDGNHRFLGSWRKDDPPFARQGTYFGGGTACPHQVGRAIVSAG